MLGAIQNFDPDKAAIFGVIDNYPGLVFIAFGNRPLAQQDPQHIYGHVIGDFHGSMALCMGNFDFIAFVLTVSHDGHAHIAGFERVTW